MTPWTIAKSGTEHAHQSAFMAWCRVAARYGELAACDPLCYTVANYASSKYQPSDLAMLNYIFAIPNGGQRTKAAAARLKAEGVRKGVPDVFLPFPRYRLRDDKTEHFGLWLEFKRHNGTTSPEQEDFIEYLNEHNYRAYVVYDWQTAVITLLTYLDIECSKDYLERLNNSTNNDRRTEQ